MKRLVSVFFIISLIFVLAACGTTGPEETENDLEESNNDQEPNNDQETEIETTTITLYFLEEVDASFYLAEETRELEEPTPEKVLELLMEGPESEELDSIIPEETEVLDLRVDQGICYADFTENLSQGAFGSNLEGLLVKSIVYTLIQLDEVEKVQFKIEGEIVDSIAGHIYTGEPLGEEDI